MTALEKLIKLASTDASAQYRETAREAQKELAQLLDFAASHGWLEKVAMDMFCKSPCTPTDNVSQ